jgi:hypothetical protein
LPASSTQSFAELALQRVARLMDHLHGRVAAMADNILPHDRTPRYGGYWWIILLIIILAVIVSSLPGVPWEAGPERQVDARAVGSNRVGD